MLKVLRRALGFPSVGDVILGRTPKHVALVSVALVLVAITAPGQAAVTVSAAPISVVVNTARSVTGTADKGSTTVALQQETVPGLWRTVATDTPATDGSFSLAMPTWWLGQRNYRVVTTGQQSAVTKLTVKPSYTPAGRASEYDYMVHSTIARWDPCQTIGWRVNAAQATAGALADAKTAFRRLSEATGFRFVYRGTTSVIPKLDSHDSYPRDTQIVVAWIRKTQSNLFKGQMEADAIGSPYYLMGYHNGDGSDAYRISSGAVVIDSRFRVPGGFGSGLTRGDILLHELGHVMGLGHVNAGSEMMNPYMTRGVARYGKGDLAGLEKHGAEMGCLYAGSSKATAGRAVIH